MRAGGIFNAQNALGTDSDDWWDKLTATPCVANPSIRKIDPGCTDEDVQPVGPWIPKCSAGYTWDPAKQSCVNFQPFVMPTTPPIGRPPAGPPLVNPCPEGQVLIGQSGKGGTQTCGVPLPPAKMGEGDAKILAEAANAQAAQAAAAATGGPSALPWPSRALPWLIGAAIVGALFFWKK